MSPSALAVLRLRTRLELGRLHDRQVGRLFTLEDAAGVDTGLVVRLIRTGSVAHKTASHGDVAPFIDRWDPMMRCQRHDLIAPTIKESIGADNERTSPVLDQGCKGAVDLAFGTGSQDLDLQIESAGCGLQLA